MQRIVEIQLVRVFIALTCAAMFSTHALAESKNSKPDADALEQKARQVSIERFKDFMQDKNIQTAAKGPDGKKIEGKVKKSPNPDDKNPFESDLTYHDRSYKKVQIVKDDSKPNDPTATKIEIEKAFKSPHGKLSAAGGSSSLERKSEEVDKKFEEEDKKNKNKKPEEGITYDGMFKKETKEVKEKDIQKANNGASANGNPLAQAQSQAGEIVEKDEENNFISVSKTEIREEAVKDFEDIGKNAADTVIAAGKDPEQKDNPNALMNGVLGRAGVAENLMAWFRSTMANLGQRRANQAIAPLAGNTNIDRIELDEETPTCEAWKAKAQAELAKAPKDAQEQLQKDLDAMTKQCGRITSESYSTVNPKYIADQKEGTYKYSVEGAKSEDGLERDSRLQLEVMAKAGKSVTEFESNWKYDTADDKVTINRYDENGEKQEIQTTTTEEIEGYNNQLRKAKEGYEEVAKRIENFTPPDPTQYEIQPGEKSVMEISQAPASAMEDYGVEGRGSLTEQPPDNYDQLLNQ